MNIELQLTEDNIKILQLFAQGFYAKQVADRMSLKKKTVDKQMERIREKLGCKTTIEAVHVATKEGLI
jgi:DNA-binding NarL/FixJ family response regulator